MNNLEEVIYGRNAVTEAIKSGMAINKILIASGEISGSLKAIIGLAKANHIVYQFVDRNKLNELSGGKNHQGVLLFAAAGKYYFIINEKNNVELCLIYLNMSNVREKTQDLAVVQ